jgi:hypothetical protein
MLGQVGKEKMQAHGKKSDRVLTPGLTALLLAALSGASACSGTPTVTYTGEVRPLAGVCEPTQHGILTITGSAVQFGPSQGVTILKGRLGAGGTLTAASDAPGMDRKPYHLSLTSTVQGDAVTGTYVTPRCRYSVNLHRTNP